MSSINNQNQMSSSQPITTNRTKSYVAATLTKPPPPTFPNRDQAIILHAIANTVLFEYVKAVGDIVTPKNITFASRISNNRICIYLSSSNIVNDLLSAHESISINSKTIPIRRLITPAKRILISDVSPTIPHAIT